MSDETIIIEPLAVTIQDACAMIGVKRTKLYALCEAGEIELRKIGRRSVITMASLKKFIANLK
jgi:excisionase family DNA binding protein